MRRRAWPTKRTSSLGEKVSEQAGAGWAARSGSIGQARNQMWNEAGWTESATAAPISARSWPSSTSVRSTVPNSATVRSGRGASEPFNAGAANQHKSGLPRLAEAGRHIQGQRGHLGTWRSLNADSAMPIPRIRPGTMHTLRHPMLCLRESLNDSRDRDDLVADGGAQLMLARTEPACLVIADIAGYSGYLAGVELDHAQDILADLVERDRRRATPGLQAREARGRRRIRLRAGNDGRRARCSATSSSIATSPSSAGSGTSARPRRASATPASGCPGST